MTSITRSYVETTAQWMSEFGLWLFVSHTTQLCALAVASPHRLLQLTSSTTFDNNSRNPREAQLFRSWVSRRHAASQVWKCSLGTTTNYLKRGEKVSGPFSLQHIRRLLKEHRLKANDLVAESKEGPWKRVAEVYKTLGADREKNSEPIPKAKPVEEADEYDTTFDGLEELVAGLPTIKKKGTKRNACPICGRLFAEGVTACHYCASARVEMETAEIGRYIAATPVRERVDPSEKFPDVIDILVCLFCACFGLLLGLIALCRGQVRRGAIMILVALLAPIIILIFRELLIASLLVHMQ